MDKQLVILDLAKLTLNDTFDLHIRGYKDPIIYYDYDSMPDTDIILLITDNINDIDYYEYKFYIYIDNSIPDFMVKSNLMFDSNLAFDRDDVDVLVDINDIDVPVKNNSILVCDIDLYNYLCERYKNIYHTVPKKILIENIHIMEQQYVKLRSDVNSLKVSLSMLLVAFVFLLFVVYRITDTCDS